ncbi:uncharacterized protein LOC100836891 [Brachypodium distachyon]|nr:uncharacterized protein LOC100836891 [Brachypodium distachyon]|eukprot:XP_010238922.1 uncharacterized protein LOC100836891 [Brachypodium distachyon]
MELPRSPGALLPSATRGRKRAVLAGLPSSGTFLPPRAFIEQRPVYLPACCHGTEVLRPHDPLARHHASTKRSSPRPSAAARRHHAGGAARRGQAAGAAASPVLPRVKVAAAAAEAAYAGPAFGAMSPSPRALPLPRFSSKAAAAAAATVDDSATRELRRLLGLERFTTN